MSDSSSLLGGSGNLVCRSRMGATGITIWLIRVVSMLTKAPRPSKLLVGEGLDHKDPAHVTAFTGPAASQSFEVRDCFLRYKFI